MNEIRVFLLLLFFSCSIHASLLDSSLSGVFNPNSKAQILLQGQDDVNHLFVFIKGVSTDSLGKAKKLEKNLLKSSQINTVYFDISNIDSESKIASVKNINIEEIRHKLELIKLEMQNSLLYTPIDVNDPLGIINSKVSIDHKDGFLTLKDRGYLIIATVDSKSSETMQLIKELDKEEDIVAFSPLEYFDYNQKRTKHEIALLLSIGLVILFLLYFVILKNLKIILLHFLVQVPIFIIASLVVIGYFDSIHIFTIAFGISFSSIGIDYLLHNYFGEYLKNKKLSPEVFFGFFSTIIGFLLLFFVVDMLILKEIALYSAISIFLNYVTYSLFFQKLNLPIKRRKLNLKFFKLNVFYILGAIVVLLAVDIATFKTDLDPSHLNLKANKIDKKAEIFRDNVQKSVLFYDAGSFIDLYSKCREFELKIDDFDSFCARCVMDKKKLSQRLEEIKNALIAESRNLGFRDNFFVNSYTQEIAKECSEDNIIKYQDRYYSKAKVPIDATRIDEGLYSPLDIAKDEMRDSLNNLLLSFALFSVTLILLVLLFSKQKLISFIYLVLPLLFAVFVVTFFYGGLNILHVFSLILSLLILVDFSLYATTKNGTESIFYAASTTLFGFGILTFSTIPTLYSIGIVISSAMIVVLLLNSLDLKLNLR